MDRDQLDARLEDLFTSADDKVIKQGNTIILTMTFKNGWSETDSCTFHEFEFNFDHGVEVCKQRIMQRMSAYEEYAFRAYEEYAFRVDEKTENAPEEEQEWEWDSRNIFDSHVQYWEIKKATGVRPEGDSQSVFYPVAVVPKAPVFEEYEEAQAWIKKYGNLEA